MNQTQAARMRTNQAVVETRFPRGSRQILVEGIDHVFYEFDNDFGHHYSMAAYFHAETALYRVKMLDPDPFIGGGDYGHPTHRFADGDLCLARSIGVPTLEAAYAKSVLFSLGWSSYQATGEFAF